MKKTISYVTLLRIVFIAALALTTVSSYAKGKPKLESRFKETALAECSKRNDVTIKFCQCWVDELEVIATPRDLRIINDGGPEIPPPLEYESRYRELLTQASQACARKLAR